MENGCYYRSTHPKVAEYVSECARLNEEFVSQIEALEAEFPQHKVVIDTTSTRDRRWFAGLNGSNPGELWQMKARDFIWTPRRKSKAGKDLAARLDKLRVTYPNIPGMPPGCISGITSHNPGFKQISGVFWVSWPCGREVVERYRSFDPEIWQPAKASEYWLAKEAEERREALEVTTTTE